MLYPIAFIAAFSALLLVSAVVGILTLYAIYRRDGGKMGIVSYFRIML